MTGLRCALVLLTLLVVQTAILDDLRFFGVAADLLLVLAVAGGLVAGPRRGAVIGFAAGLTYDLVLTTPFGMSALSYLLVAYGVGVATSQVSVDSRGIRLAAATAACAAGVLLYVGLGAILGQDHLVGERLPVVLAVVTVVGGLLALPFTRVARWMLAPLGRDLRS